MSPQFSQTEDPDLPHVPASWPVPRLASPSVVPVQLATPPVQFTLGFSPENDLEHVREQVIQDDDGKWDLALPRRELAWRHARLELPDDGTGLPLALRPSPWAEAQLCQKLAVPVAYFRRCPPALQEAQLNHWLGSDEDGEWERWLLRGKESALRAVLSDRYSRLDNRVLLDALLPVLDDGFQVTGFSLTDESLHLRLIDPLLARDVRPDDRLLVGLHVANSEVGKRAVTVDALVYRLVCQNGLVKLVRGKSLLYQRHLYVNVSRFQSLLRQAIGGALTAGAAFLEQLERATRTPIPDVEQTLRRLGEEWRLSNALLATVRSAMLLEPPASQETLYGLVNGLTRAAQSLPPDDRYDLEVLAGRLAETGLPPRLRARNSGSRPPEPVADQETRLQERRRAFHDDDRRAAFHDDERIPDRPARTAVLAGA